jgi:exo-1,4-beta-D-glucosaminidase
VDTETLDEASLTITTEVVNYSQRAVNGKLTGKSEDFEFNIPVNLKAGETKQVTLGPADVKSLRITHPRLWWCNTLGEPNLYNLNMQFVTDKTTSDVQDLVFGIREKSLY